MPTLTIHDVPEDVYDPPGESAAHPGLVNAAQPHLPRGIDFAALHQRRAELSFTEDGPAWDDDLHGFAITNRG